MQQEAQDLIWQYACIFSQNDLDLGKTSIVKHSIKVNDPTPFKEQYRCIPPGMYDEVKVHIQEMLDAGAISPSNSPWASVLVLAHKKDGKLRFGIDLQKLNARTIKDAYSLPRIEETLDCLNGVEWFSSLDLKSGYWEVEMEEDSKACTAFTVGPLGFYECEHMPFRLTNAPTTFQQLMQSCLGNLHLHYCIIYLDDVIVFSKTLEDHLLRLRAVFEKLNQAGLKLKPLKCELLRQELIYLGHVVSTNGIQTDPKKVKAICKWPVPTNVTEARSFLGFTNYYWRFIKKYAQVVKPLYKLILGENALRKQNSIKWDLECQHTFDNLKELCTTTPILAYADFAKPFKLHTDASVLGLGTVLYQVHKGVEKVISYASRSLTKTETKYLVHKLEFLCLKWVITEQFYEYLYGNTFDIYTDNNPLTYVLMTAKLDAMRHRWIAGLANCNFHIHYQSGKSNVEADALSRIDWEKDDRTLQADSIQAIVTAALTGQGNDYIETIPCSPQIIQSLIPSIHDNAQVV